MKFKNGKEMLSYIIKKGDLYNPKLQTYVFAYNDQNAICTYVLPTDKAVEIAKLALKNDYYWSSYLGAGGSIYDAPTNLEWCENHYMLDGWIPTIYVQQYHDIKNRMTVVLSLKELYKTYNETLSFVKIECFEQTKPNAYFYNMYNLQNQKVCMEGESCELISCENGIYTLLNKNGEIPTVFQLTEEEFDVCAYL